MPETIAYMEAVVGADITSFRRAMAQVRSDMTGMHTGISQSLRNIGRDMTYALTVPLVAIGAASVKMASDYDRAIHNIASISEDFFQNMKANSDAILAFGATTMSGPTAAAEAYYQVVSAGITNAKDAMAIMQSAVLTSEAGLANLEDTTKGLTQALLAFSAMSDPAFNGTADAAQHFSNVLTRTVQLGVGSMDEFVTSMGRAVAATAAAGGSYDDLGIAVSYFTQRGLTAYNASTSMNNMMNKLISPTEEMTKVFTELGVATGRELFEKFGDIGGVMNALYSVVGNNTERWGELFNTIQAKRGVFTITNDMAGFLKYIEEFNSGLDTATQTARDIQLMSFDAQVKLLGSSLQALGITIGQVLMPVLIPIIQKFTQFFLTASQLNPAVLELVVAVAALAAALGPLIWLLGTLISPLGIIAVGAAAIITNFNGIRDTITSMVNTALPSLGRLTDALSGFFGVLTAPDNKNSWDYLGNNMSALQQTITGNSTSFTVKPGDTLWDLAPITGLTIEQMMEATGITDPTKLQPGDYTYGDQMATTVYNLLDPADSTLGGRLQSAWLQFGEEIKQGITDVFNELVNWVKTDGAFLIGEFFGTIGAELYRAVATFFLADKSGGDGSNFVSTFASNLSAGVQQGIENAGFEEGTFNNFVSNVVTAVITAFAAWKFVGMLPIGGFVQGLIGSIFTTIVGSSVGSAVAGGALKGGIGNAIGSWIGRLISGAVLGGIGVIKLVPLAVSMLADSVFGAFVDILGVGPGFWLKYNFGAVGSLLANVGSSLVGLLAAIIGSPIVMGVITGAAVFALIPQETLDSIATAVLTALGLIINGVGEEGEQLETWRAGAEAVLADLLAGVFRALGRPDIAAQLEEEARAAGERAAQPIRDGLRNGILEGMTAGEPIDPTEVFFAAFGVDVNGNPFDVTDTNTYGMENGQLIGPDFATGGFGRSNPKRSGGNTRDSIFKAPIDMMKTDIQTGMAEVNTELSTEFAITNTTLDTAAVDVETKLNNFAVGVLAAVPNVLSAFSILAINVGIGMNKLLIVVTDYANQIIAKWNEMMATIGAAPTMVGYSPAAYQPPAGGGGTTVNMYITTDKASKVNEAFANKGISLVNGVTGLVKAER